MKNFFEISVNQDVIKTVITNLCNVIFSEDAAVHVDKYGKRTSRSSRETPLPDCEKLANTGVTRDTKPSPTRSPTTQPTIRRTTQPATKNSQPTSLGKYPLVIG